MLAFEVKDMTCGHCAGAITQALKTADNGVQVQIDLATHRVQVEPATADAETLALAIKDAGYTPVPADATVREVAAVGRRSCCGHCK